MVTFDLVSGEVGPELKTNKAVAELAVPLGFEVEAHLWGGRAGPTELLIVLDPKRRTVPPVGSPGQSLEAEVEKRFGFRQETKKNVAAAMYLSPTGATTGEVQAVVRGPHLNLLKEVEKRGHIVKREKKLSPASRQVTSYKIVCENLAQGNTTRKRYARPH